MSIPNGSGYVKSETPNVDQSTVLSLPAISRRSILQSLVAACGFAATPLRSPAIDLLEALELPPSDTIQAASLMCGDSLSEVMPSSAYVKEGCLWRHINSPLNSSTTRTADDYHIEQIDLTFFVGGRCYIPVECTLDLPDEDAFRPRHLLDWPRIPADYGNFGCGRAYQGLQITRYSDAEEIMTREEAFAEVAEENLGASGSLEDGETWWVVVQIGAEVKPSWVDISLTNGVGHVEPFFDLACRIAVPTPAEVARFGLVVKGGA